MAKKEHDSAIGYVILGIVAIMAIVGLVLLFTTATTTGQVSRGYYTVYDSELGNAAAYRVGQGPQPVAYTNRVQVATSNSDATQKSIA